MKTDGKHSNLIPGKGPKFSKTNQPSPEAKKAGHRKRKTTLELLRFILNGTDEASKDLRRLMSGFTGIPEEELKQYDLEEIMDLRQIEKSIKKSDTQSYKAVKELIYGTNVNIDMKVEIKKQIIKIPDGKGGFLDIEL